MMLLQRTTSPPTRYEVTGKFRPQIIRLFRLRASYFKPGDAEFDILADPWSWSISLEQCTFMATKTHNLCDTRVGNMTRILRKKRMLSTSWRGRVRLVYATHPPSHPHPLSQSELFLPLETGKINHCAQNSRSLDWLAECCQFVGGPKTILIEVCRCTSNSHLVTTESPRKWQESSKSSRIWCVVWRRLWAWTFKPSHTQLRSIFAEESLFKA